MRRNSFFDEITLVSLLMLFPTLFASVVVFWTTGHLPDLTAMFHPIG